jgi:Major Facilitator Superfamily.
MASTTPIERSIPGKMERISTRVAFFIAGFAIAAWAPLVPFAKSRLALDEATLGLVLLCLGIGSIVSMPLVGMAAARFGCRNVIWAGAIALCLIIPCLAIAPSMLTLAITLFLFGAAVGTIDVTVNIQAVIIEKASGRSLMSGFHGMFSFGGIIGAGGMSLLLSLGVTPFVATLIISAIILGSIVAIGAHLLPYGSEEEGASFVFPKGIILFLGLLAFICFLTEGAILDWGAVYMSSAKGVPPELAGWGYTIFSVTMTVCRLYGDRIVQRLGDFKSILFGGLFSALGYAIVVVVPHWIPALLGFAFVGIGAANIVPIFFSAAGKQSAMPANQAIAALTFLGYGGILLGPALIGFIAEATSLSIAFVIVAAMMVFVGASAKVVTR